MSRREDLERLIRESYGIIRAYEQTIQTSDRPEEKLRSQHAVDAQWVLVEGYLEAYLPLTGDVLPPDIAEIAVHFPSMPGQRPRPAPTPLEDEPGRAPGVQQEARIRQRIQEAQASWDMLSKRIAALQRDLVLELDGERKIVLQERFDASEKERREVEAELERLTRLRRGAVQDHATSATAEPPGATSNPFGNMGRIVTPDRFFDREELLRQVFEELGKGVNLSLVGDPQVGKSSLLSMICALGAERMESPPERFAYLNLEVVDDEDEFYAALCDALGIQEPCRGYRLTRALRGKRYVLCVDEIEKMAWEGFTARVRSQLRGLADGPAAPLKLVIASRSPLARLFPDSPQLTSPLAGICHQLDVGPFPPDVARAFLAHHLRGTGVTFTEDQVAALLAESGGYPTRLQRAAAELYARLAS